MRPVNLIYYAPPVFDRLITEYVYLHTKGDFCISYALEFSQGMGEKKPGGC